MNAGVLAHHEPFRIGAVEVRPATKTLLRDGRETVVEPRVMQVLVALAEAKGEVVSRDDLVAACWDGRIVGDDAVNRIMSRLRRLATGVGQGSFVIETVTKVGYRLRLLDSTADGAARSQPVDRRDLLRLGAATAAIAAAGGVGVWLWPRGPSADTRALMDQANLALRQGTREGQTQAVGLYQRVVADDPAYADGWATLGLCYAFIARSREAATARIYHQRARDAGRRSLAIDRQNALAQSAIASARPILGNWRIIENELRAALAEHERNEQLLFAMSHLLGSVGRTREAVACADRLDAVAPPTPQYIFKRSWLLWSAGRLEEADALLADAARLYPTHFAIWFSRFYIPMYTGRPDAALALASDRGSLPTNIPAEEIGAVVRVAQAMQSREPTVIDAVLAEQVGRARRAAGAAENAFHFAAALGRPDISFAVMNAYYFGEGFDPGEVRFTLEQGTYTPRNDRLTGLLFNPVMASQRTDPRFATLTARLGLADYWRAVGKQPDYLTPA